MKNTLVIVLFSLLIPSYTTALSIRLPRSPSPKGGGRGGGSHGGGGGGGHSSGGSHSSSSSSSSGSHSGGSSGSSSGSHSSGSSGSSSGSHSGGSSSGSNGSGGSKIATSGAGNTGRGGSGNTGKPAIAPTTVGSIKGKARLANYFSNGGGKPFTLGSSSVFSGRQMGGGARYQLVGTRRYGSGYPYYVGNYPYVGVVGQPFPFGFWPVYWAGHGHGDEYHGNNTVNSERPGGNLTMVELAPTPGAVWNTSAVNGINETYWIIGDYDSVTTMLSLLVDPANNADTPYGCSCQNLGPYSFNTDGNTSGLPVHFENVMQWYRSSSFALAYAGYNNTDALAPLNETGTLGWDDSVPLPTQQLYSPFLDCINNTITAALPIVDAPPNTGLSGGAIAGIVIGSIAGALILGGLLFFLWLRCIKNKLFKRGTRSASVFQPKDTSASPLLEDSAGAESIGGFLSRQGDQNRNKDIDLNEKKGPLGDEKKERKGPLDDHKDKSGHGEAESDESPNTSVLFPEPKVY